MNLKMLIYCTKAKGKNYYLRRRPSGRYLLSRDKGEIPSVNGKIVAECDFNLLNIYGNINEKNQPYYEAHSSILYHEYWLSEKSCLSHDQLVGYLGAYKGLVGHAICIKNLEIFEQPKELEDLYIKGAYQNAEQMFTDEIQIDGERFHPMERAPQNMCYAYDKYGNKYVVISVHPEWLCLILNGLKDVELRRKVLKEMK